MKHNYTGVASKWKADNKNWRKNAFIDPNTKTRCMERGLWQYRTENSPDQPSTPRGRRRRQRR